MRAISTITLSLRRIVTNSISRRHRRRHRRSRPPQRRRRPRRRHPPPSRIPYEVYFEFDRATVTPDARQVVQQAAQNALKATRRKSSQPAIPIRLAPPATTFALEASRRRRTRGAHARWRVGKPDFDLGRRRKRSRRTDRAECERAAQPPCGNHGASAGHVGIDHGRQAGETDRQVTLSGVSTGRNTKGQERSALGPSGGKNANDFDL